MKKILFTFLFLIFPIISFGEGISQTVTCPSVVDYLAGRCDHLSVELPPQGDTNGNVVGGRVNGNIQPEIDFYDMRQLNLGMPLPMQRGTAQVFRFEVRHPRNVQIIGTSIAPSIGSVNLEAIGTRQTPYQIEFNYLVPNDAPIGTMAQITVTANDLAVPFSRTIYVFIY